MKGGRIRDKCPICRDTLPGGAAHHAEDAAAGTGAGGGARNTAGAAPIATSCATRCAGRRPTDARRCCSASQAARPTQRCCCCSCCLSTPCCCCWSCRCCVAASAPGAWEPPAGGGGSRQCPCSALYASSWLRRRSHSASSGQRSNSPSCTCKACQGTRQAKGVEGGSAEDSQAAGSGAGKQPNGHMAKGPPRITAGPHKQPPHQLRLPCCQTSALPSRLPPTASAALARAGRRTCAASSTLRRGGGSQPSACSPFWCSSHCHSSPRRGSGRGAAVSRWRHCCQVASPMWVTSSDSTQVMPATARDAPPRKSVA